MSASFRWALRFISERGRAAIANGDLILLAAVPHHANAVAEVRGSAPALTVPLSISTMMPALEFIDQGFLISTLWPRFASSSFTVAGMRFSNQRSPGYMVCGKGDAGKLRV